MNKKETNQSESVFQAIVENSVAGIVTIDSTGIIQSLNPAAEKIFGYSSKELLGKNVKILMPEPDRSHHDKYVNRYMESGQKKIIGIGREVVGLTKNGRTFPLSIAVNEVIWGNAVFFSAVLHDLTETKQKEEELLRARNMAAIGEMASSVAHEIKNPLAGISGAIQVLRDSLSTERSICKILDDVLAQVDRVDNSIRDLLQLSRSWTPEKQSCDIRSLMNDIVSSVKQQKRFHQIEVLLKGKKKLEAVLDPLLFDRVIWNLLDNAAHAMPEGGRIECYLDNEKAHATITVTDTGTGIPSDFQNQLFRPFRSTKSQGTGLGLSICKNIIEAHNGTISISSQPGQGTQVLIRLPIVPRF